MSGDASQVVETERLRNGAQRAVTRLQDAGFTAFWAGGCVRDLLLGNTPKDYDIATDARPDKVLELFPGSVAVGKAFAVIRARLDDDFFEVATFRCDHAYRDGRRPERVTFTDPETDARRRDFTINALFYDPVTEEVHDFVDGRGDLAAKLVRCVGVPQERFAEDHLRMLRAVRFSTTLDFRLDSDTAAAIRRQAGALAAISAERIRDELVRILVESVHPGQALELLDEVGLLQVVLPEVAAMKGQKQPPQFHPEGDVFEHTVLMLNLTEERSAQLAFAALLHDVGKPLTYREADRIRFDGHAAVSGDLARDIMRRLRFSNEDTDAVDYSVRHHMRFMDVQRMKESSLRRMVAAPTFPLELELHRLDCLASHGELDNYDFLVAFCEKLASEPVLPAPWVSGHDVMRLGVDEGPEVGRWLRVAFDAQMDGRFADGQALLEWLEGEIKRSSSVG